jgi:serine/threonine protein kinase
MNFNDKKILHGIFLNQDKMSFPCIFKIATEEEQLKKLRREKNLLELIRRRDPHHESHKYIVGWLFPSQLMGEESLYFLDGSGVQLFPFSASSPRAPVQGLVLESGGKNLREFLKNQTLSSVPMTQRIHILEEVLEAVKFLHRLSVVHFDLKPENIVCFASGDQARWKLIDFDSSYDEKPAASSSSSAPLSPRVSSHSPLSPRVAYSSIDSPRHLNLWLTEEFVCPEISRTVHRCNSSDNLQSGVDINWRMDIWSLGMVAFFLFTNRSLWSDYSTAPFQPSMVSNIRQDEIQLILSRSLGHKEKSFVESCLRLDPLSRLSATDLLGKSLFSTKNSTVDANTLRMADESMVSRFDEIQRLVREYSDRSCDLMSEELTSKFGDFFVCLTTELERVSNMSHDEKHSVLEASLPSRTKQIT